MAQQFKIGDTVRLKSGSPLMTVTGVGKDGNGVPRVTTSWFAGSEEKTGSFPMEAVESDDGGPVIG
jgi:uncharacterized protein YodC (DUF2158 family)